MSRGLGLPIQRYREPRLEMNTVYASRIYYQGCTLDVTASKTFSSVGLSKQKGRLLVTSGCARLFNVNPSVVK